MATVLELVDLLKGGGEGIPETIYDDISAAYNTEVDGFAAGNADRDSVIAEKDAEIARLKSVNYDLLIASGVEIPGATSEDPDDPTPEGDENPSDEETPLESLFGESADDDEDEKE